MEKEGVLVCEDYEFDCLPSRRKYSITELGDVYLEYLANALMEYGREIDVFLQIYDKQIMRGFNENTVISRVKEREAKNAETRH